VWGQCTESMQNKIMLLDDYDDMDTELDGIRLLVAIKDASYDYQSTKYRFQSVFEAHYRLMTFHQNTLTVQQYYETFRNMVQVCEHCGGGTELYEGCVEFAAVQEGWNAGRVTAAQRASVREMQMATMFLLHSDKARFGNLIIDTENSYARGIDTYPKSLSDALNMLVNYKDRIETKAVKGAGVSFTNVGDEGEQKEQKYNKKQKRNKDNVSCWHCEQKGHFSYEEMQQQILLRKAVLLQVRIAVVSQPVVLLLLTFLIILQLLTSPFKFPLHGYCLTINPQLMFFVMGHYSLTFTGVTE
jgi:hypothetical protein